VGYTWHNVEEGDAFLMLERAKKRLLEVHESYLEDESAPDCQNNLMETGESRLHPRPVNCVR
jgi:hypothetical protein